MISFVINKLELSSFHSARKNHPLIKMINGALVDLPTPVNISNFWNYGSCLGFCLGLQLITGLFLAGHYTSDSELAFDSVTRLMRDVDLGWLFRIIHLNGASFFFIFLFLHIARGLYYKSFQYMETWNLGSVIFILSMGTAFLGYVLPWGQMSFWGATVITNLISAIPLIGSFVVSWVWGGFSVGGPTLSRFFMLHFCLPFIISALVILHLFFLHKTGSQNPTNVLSKYNLISFHWYLTAKDVTFFLFWVLVLEGLVFLLPFKLGDPENFILANPLVTPVHIVPEWYFLFAYAILRSIPNKLGGVIALALSVVVLLLPSFFSMLNLSFRKTLPTFRGNQMNPSAQMKMWLFLGVFLILTWIGGEVVEEPFISMGQVFLVAYFVLFFEMTKKISSCSMNSTLHQI